MRKFRNNSVTNFDDEMQLIIVCNLFVKALSSFKQKGILMKKNSVIISFYA